MADTSEAFRSLVKDERFEHIRTAIADKLAEHTVSLPDDSQISEQDRNLVDIFFDTLDWVAMNEERGFTGDPIGPFPDNPVAILLLRRMGLIDQSIS
jgi:hypothetical protein